MKVRIVIKDGEPFGKLSGVFLANGERIEGVTSVEFLDPIHADSIPSVRLTIYKPDIDIVAEAAN